MTLKSLGFRAGPERSRMPKTKVDRLIKHAVIITMNKNREVLWDGAIALRAKRIVDVGPSSSLIRKYEGKIEIEARQKLVLPGLVNAHNHMFGALCRGLVNDHPLIPWLKKKVYLTSTGLDEESYYLSTLLLGIEMLKTGTTCVVDCGTMPGLEGSAVRAIDELGMKAVLARTMVDITGDDPSQPYRTSQTTRKILRDSERFVQKHHGDAQVRIQAWFCPIQTWCSSDPLCKKTLRLAERYDSGVATHASVDRVEVELCRERFGYTPIERFHRLGVLGPRLLAAHMGWITDKEIDLILERGAHIAHCPGSSMKCASGAVTHGRIPLMGALGANIALGTDGPAAGNYQDMFRVMYLGAVGHKEAHLDSRAIPPETVLEWGTLNGAKAVGWGDQTGSLEKGKRADVVLLNLKRPEFIPLHSDTLLPNLIYAATGGCVETVLVDGRILVEDGRVTTVDEDEVIHRISHFTDRFIGLARDWERKYANENFMG